MIVLLPPSETKRGEGDGPPLRLEKLANPGLGALRAALVGELVDLAADPPACRTALGVSPSQDSEIERNAALRTAPTLPALRRYTGVLYDALDVDSLRGAEAKRARARLAIGSALFGLLRADDQVPAYRLSATSKLPAKPTLAARWKPLLEPLLAELAAQDLIVDLRSGSYVTLGPTSGAIHVKVLAEHPDGRRTVVTHFNKAYKGRLARILASTRAEPADAAAVAAVARRAGMQVERSGNELTLVVAAGG
ncbi:peroxide stress protein YaaA [Mycobacterium marinum]|uniref:peroxide stress protein YaaA n=1 Tax=Mycobacterium marinum TaxID=1781 RepID=UPI00356570BA